MREVLSNFFKNLLARPRLVDDGPERACLRPVVDCAGEEASLLLSSGILKKWTGGMNGKSVHPYKREYCGSRMGFCRENGLLGVDCVFRHFRTGGTEEICIDPIISEMDC